MGLQGWLSLGLFAALLTATVGGQKSAGTSDAVSARLTSLLQQIDSIVDTTDDLVLEQAELIRLTEQLHRQIDRYVSTFPPLDASAKLQDRLRAVLDPFAPHRELTDPAIARVKDAASGRTLVTAYAIKRGSYSYASSIRGYREAVGGRFELAATTDGDRQGATMSIAELPSPIVGETWLLVWGYSPSANGSPRSTFRVYAFDGYAFRTLWRSSPMFMVKVRVTDDGFVIDHMQRGVEPVGRVESHYVLTLDGPRQITRP